MITFITGGVKSGKSSRALNIVTENNWNAPVSFIATAESDDGETAERIKRHREERAAFDGLFETIEEPLRIDNAVKGRARVVVDCIPMWVNNLIYHKRENEFEIILRNFIRVISNCDECVIVSNETGWGNIPFDETTRQFNFMLSQANKEIAAASNSVELMVAGLSLKVK